MSVASTTPGIGGMRSDRRLPEMENDRLRGADHRGLAVHFDVVENREPLVRGGT